MRVAVRSLRATLVVALILIAATAVCAAFGAGAARAAPGSFVWRRTLDPTARADEVWLCARGPHASVYACGTRGWPDTTRVWLVKYTAAGKKAWSRSWAGPAGLMGDVYDIAVDSAGSVYVAGRTRPTASVWDSALLKYDASGHLKWADTWAASAQDDEMRAIALDAAGNVYVAGNGVRSGDWDIFTAKYRPTDGVQQWATWYDGSGYDSGFDIAVDHSGVSYVAGNTNNLAQPDEALLVKTSASGAFVWAKTWGTGAVSHDEWLDVAIARSGAVLVAGETSDADSDLAVASYTAAGARTWVHTLNSGGAYDDYLEDSAVARDGSLWMIGYTQRAGGSARGELLRWTPAGTVAFGRIIGTGRKPVELRSLTLDDHDNAYLAGDVKAAGGGTDALAMKYTPGGALRWRSSAAFAGKTQDQLFDIVPGGPGFLYGCGAVAEGAADARGLVVKLRR
jgi:hypothetical protein